MKKQVKRCDAGEFIKNKYIKKPTLASNSLLSEGSVYMTKTPTKFTPEEVPGINDPDKPFLLTYVERGNSCEGPYYDAVYRLVYAASLSEAYGKLVDSDNIDLSDIRNCTIL